MKAYPTTYRNYDESISIDCSGMDLRDYFAAKCLQGMAIFGPSSMVLEETAKFAYEYADAMMEARVKK